MSKAIIFSDLHLHNHKDGVDRLQNCLDVLEWIFEEAKKNNCDYIFFLGDLFHERAKIDVKNYLKTFEIFMKHMLHENRNMNMYLLVGNHDMYHKETWDVNSIKPFSAIPNVHIIDKPQQISFGKRKIDWIPYTNNPVEELIELKKSNKGSGEVLLGHLAVDGALLNLCYGTKSDVIVEYDNDMVAVNEVIFEDWKMVFLGHYHGSQQIGNIEYVGSPLQLTFGEAFQQKHIILLDLNTLKKEYIINDFSPKHFIVEQKDIEDENYNLNGNFVRLTVDSMSSKDLIHFKKDIAEKYKFLTLDTKQKERKKEDDQVFIDNANSAIINIDQMLEKYIKERGVPEGIDEKTLLLKGKKCLENKVLS